MVARLRQQRGLRQVDVAEAVGCDTQTIAKVEQGRGRWRPHIARAVYDVLSAASPLTAEEHAAYMRHTGLSLPPPQEPPPAGFRRARPPATPEQRTVERLHWLLDSLIAHAGIDRTAAGLVGLAEATGALELTDSSERIIRVAHPPVQRPGYVEQRFVDYAVPAPAATPAAKARRR